MAMNSRLWGGMSALSSIGLAVSMGTALASGFQIHEQSAKALGNALAGATAGAEDVSYMAYNPAAIGRVSGNQVAATLSYIDPEFTPENMQASTILGTPIQGKVDDGDVNAFVPALAAKWRLSDTIDLGLGIYSFWGLETDYNRNWIGRYYAVDSSLTTVAINPVISFSPTPDFSIGFGVIAQYAEAELSNAIDFGTIGRLALKRNPKLKPLLKPRLNANSSHQDGFVRLTGEDWGFGFNLGVLYQLTSYTRVGIAYRSEVEYTIEGQADFTRDPAGIATVLGFADTPAEVDLTTPATASLGIFHRINERLAVMAEVQWTDWSTFDRLVVKFAKKPGDPSVFVNDWEDTWFASVGASYRLTERWLLRAGLAYDQSPVPGPQHRTPRIPDADRQWVALGATYSPAAHFDITGSWVHIFVDDAEINLKATDEGNRFRGNLSGSYEASADVFAVQATWHF